ncbi:MAG: hypothetical protein R2845_10765 [Thermomicrobiales bacterium]
MVDTQIVPGALFGAKGFYSFLTNLHPALAVELWRRCETRVGEAAAELRSSQSIACS